MKLRAELENSYDGTREIVYISCDHLPNRHDIVEYNGRKFTVINRVFGELNLTLRCLETFLQ